MELNLSAEEEFLVNVELPEKTETYTPVPHLDVFTKIRDIFKEVLDCEVASQSLVSNDKGRMFVGKYPFHNQEKELKGVLMVHNSYNKMMKLGMHIGYYEDGICFLDHGLQYKRVHRGSVLEEFHLMVQEYMNSNYTRTRLIRNLKEYLGKYRISEEVFLDSTKDLFFKTEIFTTNQMQTIKNITKHKDYDPATLDVWKIMMFFSQALSNVHSLNHIKSLTELSNYMADRFGFKFINIL